MYKSLTVRMFGACVLVLALSAPAATAASVTDTKRICTGDARWEIDAVNGIGTATVTSTSDCEYQATSADPADRSVSTEGGTVPLTGPFTAPITGVVAAGGALSAYVWGSGPNSLGIGPVVIVGDQLTATLAGPSPSGVGAAVGHYAPAGGCGSGCYDTTVTWVASVTNAS